MRWPTLLVLALALLAIVSMLALWTSSEEKRSLVSSEQPTSSQRPPTTISGTTSAPDFAADALERVAAGSRASAAVESKPEPATRTKFRNLRVHVLRGTDFGGAPASEVEVRAANLTGALYDAVQDGPNTYVFRDLSPGPYVVHAKSLRSRAATASVRVAADKPESEATVTLERTREVRIRWRNQYGEPISSCVARASAPLEAVRFEVRASWTHPDGRQDKPNSFEVLRLEWAPRVGGEPGAVLQRLNSWERVLESSIRPSEVIDFGTIEIEPGAPAWLSAYVGTHRVASVEVGGAADEIEIVTPCESLIADADESDAARREWEYDKEAESSRPSSERRTLEFTVVDAHGEPLRAVDFQLTLLDEKTSQPATGVLLRQQKWTQEGDVNLVFRVVPGARYELQCTSRHYSCESRIVTAPVTQDSPRIEIVVHPTVIVGIGVEPVPRPSTRIRVLGSDGATFGDREVNEFGVATFYLAPGSYGLELLEAGRVVLSSSVLVESNPTTLVLRR